MIEEGGRPPAALVAAGGVFLPGYLAMPIWRVMREDILRRERDGGRVRPEVAQALEVLRTAALAYTSARGPDLRTSVDIAAESTPKRLLTTADLAARLRVSERHARRIAKAEGIEPTARNLWAREDVAALAVHRGV